MWEKDRVIKMETVTIEGKTVKSGVHVNLTISTFLASIIIGYFAINFGGWVTWVFLFTFTIFCFSLIFSLFEHVSYCKQCNEIFDFKVNSCPLCSSVLAKPGIDEVKLMLKAGGKSKQTSNESKKLIHEGKSPIKEPLHESVNVFSAFGYKGATIIYKVKIENNTAKPISDIKVYPSVPNVFLLKEKEKSISLIEPRSSQTVTFEIRPTGECGDCNVSGRVNYYDMASMERQDIQLESKSLSIICPMLRRKEISEDVWRDLVSRLVKAEETTTDVPFDGEGLFGIISEILKDLNLFMLPPTINKSPQIFRGTARFYGEGVKGLNYAAQIEVVGGARKSKLILKAWAEKEDALTGFYHGVLDEIEKRVKVKEYIDDSIVQYNVHIGDKIGTLVKDSVVQRSNIGASARKCPNCGREVEANEKFCLECGARL